MAPSRARWPQTLLLLALLAAPLGTQGQQGEAEEDEGARECSFDASTDALRCSMRTLNQDLPSDPLGSFARVSIACSDVLKTLKLSLLE